MLNLWLMLSLDYKANFDRYHDKLHAEQVTLSVDGGTDTMQRFLSQTLESDRRTKDFCLDNCMHMTGSFQYNGGEVSSWFVFLDKETALSRSIGKAEMVEDSEFDCGIYLPVLYKTEDIDIGETVEIFDWQP